MPKAIKVEYICRSCGGQFPKWQGQCPDCQDWNTLEEIAAAATTAAAKRFSGYAGDAAANRIRKLDEVSSEGISYEGSRVMDSANVVQSESEYASDEAEG